MTDGEENGPVLRSLPLAQQDSSSREPNIVTTCNGIPEDWALRPNVQAIMIIGVALLLFFTPLVDLWIRRRQAFVVLFADDGVFHNQGRAGWADMLAYADVEAFHLERDRGRLWWLSVIRRRNKLSQGTWVEGFAYMDDDAAAAFEQDIQTRIKIAKDRVA